MSSFAVSGMYSFSTLISLLIDMKYWVSLFYYPEQTGFSLPHNGTSKSDDKGGMTLGIKESSRLLVCSPLCPVVAKYLLFNGLLVLQNLCSFGKKNS